MSFGILYVATGEKCFNEVLINSKITRSHCNLNIVLVTDRVDQAISSGLFEEVIPHPNPHYSYRDKILPLLDIPFTSTIYLDSDACVVHQNISSLVSFDTFDVAGSYAPVRIPPGWCDSRVPYAFPEINTGVLFFKKSKLQTAFIQSWLNLYDSLLINHNQAWDQASFRSVIWDFINGSPSLSFHVLPSEFNLRTTKPWTLGRGLPAYVIHGRFPQSELSPFLSYINHDIDRFRFWSEWLEISPGSKIRPRYDRTFS